MSLRQGRVGAARDQLQATPRDQLHGPNATAPLGPPPGALRSRARRAPSGARPAVPAATSAPGLEHAVGPDARPVADRRPGAHALGHHRALADRGVGQHAVGPDLGPGPDGAGAAQDHAGEQGHVGVEPGLGVDVGALGVPHRHAAAHPALVDPVAQLGLGHGQLGPVVDPGRLHGVGQDERAHRVAGAGQHGDGVGQVVLALGVGRAEPAQRRRQDAAPEAVDGRVDLVDRLLLVGGVGLLDDPGDVAVLAVHDPAVAGRVLDHGGEQRGARVLGPVGRARAPPASGGAAAACRPGAPPRPPPRRRRRAARSARRPARHRCPTG